MTLHKVCNSSKPYLGFLLHKTELYKLMEFFIRWDRRWTTYEIKKSY